MTRKGSIFWSLWRKKTFKKRNFLGKRLTDGGGRRGEHEGEPLNVEAGKFFWAAQKEEVLLREALRGRKSLGADGRKRMKGNGGEVIQPIYS